MKNEERYQTPNERNKEFTKFCIEHDCRDCQCRNRGSNCRFVWLDLEAEEAEEEKLLPCPFCGGEAKLVVNHPITTKGAYVQCTRCWTFVTGFNTEYDAIAAWNRRVK